MGGRSTERRLGSVDCPTVRRRRRRCPALALRPPPGAPRPQADSEAATGTVHGTEGLRRPRQACWHHFRSGLFAQAAYPLSLKEST